MFPGSIFNIISTFINYSKNIENFKNRNDNTYNHKAWFIIYVILLIILLIILFNYLLLVPWKFVGRKYGSSGKTNTYRLLLIIGFLFFPVANIIANGSMLHNELKLS